MPNILITGPAGSGKSYLSKKWAENGINTIDGDAMGPEVCKWITEDGKEESFPNNLKDADVEWFSSHRFLWDHKGLRKFIDDNEPVIILGTSDNVFEITDSFDKAYYLKVPYNVVKERLKKPERQEFTAFGQHEEQRDALEKMILESDQKAEALGMHMIDATLSAEEIWELLGLK
jgi:adenylate kinase family enzyme